ncbi:MAG: helix-turn-helix domain-containing protein [Candidatus Lokiarchaeota archaeon]|nr:helix-turn-helix domain-containing protein [Candidatus Lokiarchaeota archaeon]
MHFLLPIKKILHSKRFGRYFIRLFSNTIVILVLPIFLLGYLSYGISAKIIQEKVSSTYLKTLNHTTNEIELRLSSIKNSLYRISGNSYIDYLRRVKLPFSGSELYRVLKLIEDLDRVKNSDSLITEVFVYFRKLDMIIDSNRNYNTSDFFNKYYVFEDSHYLRESGSIIQFPNSKFLKTGRINHFKSIHSPADILAENSISIFWKTPISSDNPDIIAGFILDSDKIHELLHQKSLIQDSESIILNKDAALISTLKGNEALNSIDSLDLLVKKIREKASTMGAFSLDINNIPFNIIFTEVEEADWYLLSAIKTHQIIKDANAVKLLAIKFSLAALLIGAILSFFITKRLYRPINKILSKIHTQVPATNRRGNQKRLDEFSIIDKSFVDAISNKLKYEKYLAQYLPTVRERFFYHLAKGNYRDETRIQKQLEDLQIQVHNGYFIACIMEIDHFISSMESEKHIQNQYHILMISEYIMNQLSNAFSNIFTFYDGHNIGVFINSSSDGKNKKELTLSISQELASLKEEINKNLDLTVSFGIGRPKPYINRFQESYQESCLALTLKYYEGLNKVHLFSEYDFQIDKINSISPKDQIYISNTIKYSKIDELIGYIDNIAESLKVSRATPQTVKDFFHHILGILLKIIENVPYNSNTILNTIEEDIKKLGNIETYLETKQFVYNTIKKSIYSYCSTNAYVDDRITKLIEYMETYYNHELTLTGVAEHFNLSSAYLSSYFKKLTGQNFLDKLTEIRINKAKDMIETNHTITIAAIAKDSGFGSYKSFSRAFKRYAGISPEKFRKTVFN